MNFRRLPFQFTAVNPSERQAEIQKRFGLPNLGDMHLDLRNSDNMGGRNKESNSATSSPRLQHRVPVFVEDPDAWISEKSQSNNVDNGRKPNVRVIPIEIEGAGESARQRTYSGPAGIQQTKDEVLENDIKPVKHTMHNMTLPNRKRVPSGETKPRVYNIPIQVEQKENSEPFKKPNLNSSPKDLKTNGCNNGKICSDNLQKSEEKPPEPDFNAQLKKIDNILGELKSYESEVENFSGNANDKKYRYLDEMLTRLMLRLDDVETMGNSEIRNARKAAVKKVQSYIDLLENKVNSGINEKDIEMKEVDSAISSEGKDSSGESNDCSNVETVSVQNESPGSCTENIENGEISEVEMEGESEVEGVESTDKMDLDHHESTSSFPVDVFPPNVKINQADMGSQNESSKDLLDKNLELVHSIKGSVSKDSFDVEMVSVRNLERTEPCYSNSQISNDTTDLKEVPSQLQTSTDINVVESPEISSDLINENELGTQSNSKHSCDIDAKEISLQNAVKTSENNPSSNIPEAASCNDMEMLESNSVPTTIDKESNVTILKQNSELLSSKVEMAESELEDSATDSCILKIEPIADGVN